MKASHTTEYTVAIKNIIKDLEVLKGSLQDGLKYEIVEFGTYQLPFHSSYFQKPVFS